MMVKAKNKRRNSRQYLRAPSWQPPEGNDESFKKIQYCTD
jgi:hypothetical protein